MWLRAEGFGVGTWDLDLATRDLAWSATTRSLFGVAADQPVTYELFLSLLALTVLTHLDPLSYGVDGLRGAFIDVSHFGVGLDFALLVALAACFLALGARAFSRIQV